LELDIQLSAIGDDSPKAAIGAARSEWQERAHCVNSVFMLRALAAWKMLRQRKIQCCRAVGKPAIRAECSKGQGSNSQTARLLRHSLLWHRWPVLPLRDIDGVACSVPKITGRKLVAAMQQETLIWISGFSDLEGYLSHQRPLDIGEDGCE
jgi:hypothetical protein